MDPLLSRRTVLGALGAVAAFGPGGAEAQTFPLDSIPTISRHRWSWVGAQLVLEPGLTWFDTASFGPTLRAVLVRAYRHLEEQSLDFREFEALFGAGSPAERTVLASAALFFGAGPGELVLTDGARSGLGLVAAGLELAAGDEVLVTLHDHPAAVYPWLAQARRRGVRVVEVPEPVGIPNPEEIVQRFASAITPRTRVMCVAHVQDCDGAVMPVKELCALARSRGVFSLVDGALAAGHVDVRLTDIGCDAYATGLDRWLNGPVDAGLLYVRRDSQGRVWPALPDRADGWSATDRFNAPVPPATADYTAAAKLGAGSLVRRGAAISAMPVAFEFQEALGRPAIQQRIRELAVQLRGRLQQVAGLQVVTPSHPALSAGIVTVRVLGRDPGQVVDSIALEDRIVLARVRHGAGFDAIRISVHPSHDAIDVDRCVAAVQRRV
jgi:isopenicillin-N epimerase